MAAQVDVTLEGPADAELEERARGFAEAEGGWHTVCRLPCRRVVTAEPAAEHRIVDGDAKRHVSLRGAPHERLVVTYERAPSWRSPLLTGGIVVGAAGVVAIATGLGLVISNLHIDPAPDECGSDAACRQARAAKQADSDSTDATAETVLVVGVVALLAGGAGILTAAIGGRPSAHVLPASTRTTSPSEPPRPSWARPELSVPPNQVTLVNLRF
jgi:hypothetical protein